ncbi:DUF5813 family protein [Halovenus rubra]|uniref:DUF5813 family protein n=2 Tax=Halovenus rubra TaxID=869890 RepID=A0ABD5X308_9EURY|nr:DUF5813 family protein [Halovenus rubra]
MTDAERSSADRNLSHHNAFEQADTGYRLSTVVFDVTVTTTEQPDGFQYTVDIVAPSLSAATADDVGQTVQTDWFETLERRLADAPNATRTSVELDEIQVTDQGETVSIQYRFTRPDPTVGPDICKTFAEYVEGTYVEGIVPGYEYVSPVSNLLSNASQGENSGTPL